MVLGPYERGRRVAADKRGFAHDLTESIDAVRQTIAVDGERSQVLHPRGLAPKNRARIAAAGAIRAARNLPRVVDRAPKTIGSARQSAQIPNPAIDPKHSVVGPRSVDG